MEYSILQSEKIIRFKWKECQVFKDVNFTINENGCYITDRTEATFMGLGKLTIKEAMGLPEATCCCNPKHRILGEVLETMYAQVPPQFKTEKDNVPAKEKIHKVLRRGKPSMLSESDIDMIRSSDKSTSVLAKTFNCSEDYIRKIRNGLRR